MTADDRVRGIVDASAAHATRDLTARRTTWIAAAVLALCLGGGGLYFALRLDELDTRADASGAAAEQLATQVRSLGATPVVEPPVVERGARGEPGVGIASVESAPCAVVVRLTDGRSTPVDGLCGRPGRDGRSITGAAPAGCDVLLSWSDATTSRVGPMCGPVGASGQAGQDGRDGQDGQDGQPPPCMSEPSQCRGANGEKGDQGDRGVDGAPPRGWVTTRGDGSEETCTRDSGSPDSAPTYSCETTSPPTLLPNGKRIGG